VVWLWLAVAFVALIAVVGLVSALLRYLRERRYSWGSDSAGYSKEKLLLIFTGAVAGLAGAFGGGQAGPEISMRYSQQDAEAEKALNRLVACLEEEGEEDLATAWKVVAKANQVAEVLQKLIEDLIEEEERCRKKRIAQAAKIWLSTHKTSLFVNHEPPSAKDRKELVGRLVEDEERALLRGLDQLGNVGQEIRGLLALVLESTRSGRELAFSRAITDWEAQQEQTTR
jgi:hypothetical protein